ncbi:hypothetical protein ASG01_14305 [Chryseobacterium sp. Leaf180]|uniref:hypothetical protein n=1 Tax=Chryseobacterium sp. Leaf180 TaxID=1736289 RepID=UPI0006F403E0|nr:hypothetical protein [Chryseobacterium sp. Leaf180]KQR91058.1 hypothetical protein ASG01_14305 [Chryseobacterium sp. Leaf180]
MLPQYFSYIAPVFQLPQKGGNAAFSMYQYDEAINSLTWNYFKIETLERYVENFATTELHLLIC